MSIINFKSRLMAVLACALCALGASAYSFYQDTIYYNIKSDNTVEVTSKAYRTASYSGDVVIPSTVTYEGVTYTVIGIGDEAFYKCNELTSIVLPQTVKYLRKGAFNRCGNLTEAYIPDSVTLIDEWTFYDCSRLVSVRIPDGVTKIRELAFGNCTILPRVTLPESLTTIEEEAFEHCEKLDSLYLPKNVSQIHPQAFSYCRMLTNIVVDSENPYFDSREDCNAIIETATNTMVVGSNYAIIPNTVTGIGDYAFSYRQSFRSIDIPNSVKTIGNCAFASTALQNVNFNDSLISIGAKAFSGCNIQSALLPNTLTAIGIEAFKSCQRLTTVRLSENLTEIKPYVFESCTRLKEIVIPYSVTKIGYDAFAWCGLTSIFIPNSVTEIMTNPFQSCQSLTSIVVEDDNPVFDSRDNCNAIIETATNRLISGCQTTVIPNSIEIFEKNAFRYTLYKGEVLNIPNATKSIGELAFDGSKELVKLCGGDSVTFIGHAAFDACNKLKEVYLGKALKTIDRGVFSTCYNIETVVLQDSVESIGLSAFAYTNVLKSFTCKALVPPVLASTVFHADALANATLYVPFRAIEAYRAADGWSDFVHIEGLIQPVDANGDGLINVSDISIMINRVLNGEDITDMSYDMNCDGLVNITDVILMINYVLDAPE